MNNKAIKPQFKFPNPFGFYLKLLKAMLAENPLPYRFISSCGGKNSGKTYCFCLFVSYLFYYNISAIVLIFRKETKTVPQTLQEVLDRLQAAKIKHIHNKSRNTITSPSGKTKVAFYSLFNPRGEKVQQLGLTGNSNYIYELV